MYEDAKIQLDALRLSGNALIWCVGTGADPGFNTSITHQQNPNYWPFQKHLWSRWSLTPGRGRGGCRTLVSATLAGTHIIKHIETTTHDIRGSPPPWGYVHQLFFFISFYQYSTCTETWFLTPQRTEDLCTSLDPPSLNYNTNPSTVSYNHLHLALQVSHSMHKAITITTCT